MGLGCSRDGGAAERARGVKRPSLHWIRSGCCSMRLSVKRVFSLLSEAKQSIARREARVTGQQVTSHCISRCIVLPCSAPGWIRRRTSPHPLSPMVMAIRNSLLEKLEPMPVKSTGEREEKQRDEPSPLGPCGETAETLKKTATRVRRTCDMLEAERTGGWAYVAVTQPPGRRSPTQRAHPTLISVADGSSGSQHPAGDV